MGIGEGDATFCEKGRVIIGLVVGLDRDPVGLAILELQANSALPDLCTGNGFILVVGVIGRQENGGGATDGIDPSWHSGTSLGSSGSSWPCGVKAA